MKPKILLFIDWFLPGTNSGGPVRSCANLLTHLGEEFEFLVVTRDTDYCEIAPYHNVQSDSWNRHDPNTQVYYFSKENLNFSNLKELIKTTEFDSAYVNGIYSLYFSILPVYILKKLNKPIVVAARGMLNPQAFSVKPLKKNIFLRAANISGFHKNLTFHATNFDEEKNIKYRIKNDPDVLVAPNLPRKLCEEDFIWKEKGNLKLVSVARIAKEKGTLTALKALQQVKGSAPVVYDIYGSIYDENYWKECQSVIDELPKNIHVNWKGSIESAKVPAILSKYHFFIMPSEGENFGHGILEGFTAGCPVIISDNTPWRKLKERQIGWDVALRSGELISALEEALAMDQNTYDRWSKNAWRFAREVINDPEVLKANKRLFKIP